MTQGLTALGWTFMLVSTLSVTALVISCFKRVLTAPEDVAEEVQSFRSA